VLPPHADADEVTLRPIAPKPSLFPEPSAKHPPAMPESDTFIPPHPERIPKSGPRMPRIEDLPMPAQNELRAKRGELQQPEHPERRRMGLLQRLASVGLGRREEEEEEVEEPARPASAGPKPKPANRPQPPRAPNRPPESRAPDPVSEYAKRGAPQGLDQNGRQTPVYNPVQDDQLDIPAFLRRQAN
jgi:cell division protein FtsZ